MLLHVRWLRIGSIVVMLSILGAGVITFRGPRSLQVLQQNILLKVAAQCNYGEQAYRFSPLLTAGDGGPQWDFQAMDQRCSLQPLVSSLLASSRECCVEGGQIKILFNADSIDRLMVEDFCKQAGGRPVRIPSNGSDKQWSRATACNTTAVFMLHVWITGVHDDPPGPKANASGGWGDALSEASVKGLRAALGASSPEDSLRDGARIFQELTGSTTPDMVVLSSNLWDVLNWLVTDQLPRQNATLFLGDLGLQYEAGLKAHVARIRGLFPALPQLIMHTSVPLSHMRQLQAEALSRGKNFHPYEAEYMAQVNSIQRHVARHLGIPLIDYEVILRQIPVGTAFLEDGRHVQPYILVKTMLEVLLNMYATSSRGGGHEMLVHEPSPGEADA